MFTQKSRYINTEQYVVKDRRGRSVNVVSVPGAPAQALTGYHRLLQAQKIDHLAANYTADEAGFWRIAEANDKMLPESLTEQPLIAIPVK